MVFLVYVVVAIGSRGISCSRTGYGVSASHTRSLETLCQYRNIGIPSVGSRK